MADTHDTAALVKRAQAALEGTTPGPWEHDALTVWGENPRVSGYDGILVAEVGNATHDYDTFDANASLIASAPTLISDMADALTAQAAEITNLLGALRELRNNLNLAILVRNPHGKRIRQRADAALVRGVA